MPLFPDVAFPSDETVLPRLPTSAEWAAAYTATEGATAAWQVAQSAPTTETAGWPQPRVEDFLPREAGGEGLVWPPAASPLPVVVDIEGRLWMALPPGTVITAPDGRTFTAATLPEEGSTSWEEAEGMAADLPVFNSYSGGFMSDPVSIIKNGWTVNVLPA